jgi:UDP-glucose 4-epimerase
MLMRRVVVTGGAGFIGSHLADELAHRGCDVIILDDLSTGRLENIESLLAHGGAQFVEGSIADLSLLHRILQGADVVFHQAAIASVPASIEQPIVSHEVNVTGTLNVLVAAKEAGVGKVVCASSSAVYGDTPAPSKREDMSPCPQSPYAVTKLVGEYYCGVFQELFGMPTVNLRYFNVYGKRQDPNSQYAAAIPKFVSRVLEGNPPIIYGDGEQSRDFVFVRDVVEANILAAGSSATGVFNIGTGTSITINDLVRLVVKIMDSALVPVYHETRPGEVKHSLADISNAKGFGYNPQYSLEEGLKRTVVV